MRSSSHGSSTSDVESKADEPVYQRVRCSRCFHWYPVVLRDEENDRRALCEKCRGELFAAEHAKSFDQR